MPKKSSLDSQDRILSAAYLQRHSSKSDLLRRLRNVVEALSDEDVEPGSPEFPGLDGLAAVLVQKSFLNHKDKEIRLHTVLACMELFFLYAPDPPWDEEETLLIFSQMIRQLANLSHCTSPTQANFEHYSSILKKLAVVKIGVVLVDLTRTLDSDTSPSGHVEGNTREEALEMLADLIRTILQCVHIDHPPEVTSHAVAAISACLEEYDGIVPTAVMDEILIAVSAGPVVFVTNPANVEAAAKSASAKKKGKKPKAEKMPPMQLQQTNPSYMVVANVIRRTVDRMSTPIATFLNGILNGDPNVMSETSISSDENPPSVPSSHFSAPEKKATADVWSIIYELHRIAPQILTTVVGTVTNSLKSPNLEKRLRVTKLLGRLFYSPSSKIGVQFSPCYREWIGRSKDAGHEVRLVMAKSLVMILTHKGGEAALAKDASNALVNMIELDPNLNVRLQAVHQVCDLAYNAKEREAYVTARLLQAVGNRVGSKNKVERRDALTGLAQIYHRHYVRDKLEHVQKGGDDCDIEIISHVLDDTCHSGRAAHGSAKKRRRGRATDDEESDSVDAGEKYKWIPSKIFESACFSDAEDPEMRSRVIQIVDDVLLGSNAKDPLTPTSRAVGLAFILQSLKDDNRDDQQGPSESSNAYRWMCDLFLHRASLQRAVGSYVDARARRRECQDGTEEALTAEAEAMEKLELIASLTAPVNESTGSNATRTDTRHILEKLHSAKDKHIFRILATIASPNHSSSARARAFDELPKRAKALGDATAAWVKRLARRCAMGHFLNVEVINHCILLGRECFQKGDPEGCEIFLSCVKMAADIYPSICSNKDGFGTLIELFSECQQKASGKKRKLTQEKNIVTMLSSILASVAPARTIDSKGSQVDFRASELEDQLLNLCVRDGTPDQARHAVFTVAALFRPGGRTAHPIDEQENDVFGKLLKSLTSPSRLTLRTGDSENKKIVGILAALAALSECAPSLFKKGTHVGNRGDRAIKFALETCLLGTRSETRSDDQDQSEDELSASEESEESPRSRKWGGRESRKSKGDTDHKSPARSVSLLEDDALSLTCRRLCAAVEFLVSRTRHAVMHNLSPSGSHIGQLFSILCQIIKDNGLPPSSRDRRACKSRQDRGALRECSAIHLLRLCDARLKLERTYLTASNWHILSSIFLDEEKIVRSAAMEELSDMMLGQGKFRDESGNGHAFAPSLRMVALVTLCTDGDHVSSHLAANGNAAIVGKQTQLTRNAAMHCITNLRKTSDATLAQCRAVGRDAEKKFENVLKMMLMPEYAVPFAFHLLAFRRETPSAGGSIGSGLTQTAASQSQEPNDEPETEDEDSQHKVLRKRLKWIFEPLVLSLGDSADNISFLLRMTEVLATLYQPRDVDDNTTEAAFVPASPSDEKHLMADYSSKSRRAALSAAKLKIICAAAREVLLSFVKKDVNLTPYPGAIQLPSNLFMRAHSTSRPILSESPSASSSGRASSSTRESIGILRKKHGSPRASLDSASRGSSKSESRGSLSTAEKSRGSLSTTEKSRVHFSPKLVTARYGDNANKSESVAVSTPDERNEDAFGGLSPIDTSLSPRFASPHPRGRAVDSQPPQSEEKTLGTTPPSALKTLPDQDGSTDDEPNLSLSSKSSRSSASEHRVSTLESPSQSASEGSLDESVTASETKQSIGSEKKKPLKRKKTSAAPVKITMGSTFRSSVDTAVRGRRRRTSTTNQGDVFEFVDESGPEKENEKKTGKKIAAKKLHTVPKAKDRREPSRRSPRRA